LFKSQIKILKPIMAKMKKPIIGFNV